MNGGGVIDKRQLELYTNYLISNYGYATATGLSAIAKLLMTATQQAYEHMFQLSGGEQ